MSSAPPHIAIFGPGLMGASLLMALRTKSPQTELSVWARREAAVREVQTSGLADLASTDAESAAFGANTVVLCVPIDRMEEVASAIAPHIGVDTLVTDVGSTKEKLVPRLEEIFSEHRNFVGSHPMCGSEETGLSAARAGLYDNALCVVCPTKTTRSDLLERTELFWKSVGCRVTRLSPSEHDAAAAVASHVPHVAAAALVDLAAQEPESFRALCASGFRDTTRVAAGSPEVWSAILAENAENSAAVLAKLQNIIAEYREVILRGEQAEIATRLAAAAASRTKIFADS